MIKTINYNQDYVIAEQDKSILINLPIKKEIYSINNIQFKENSIFLIAKDSDGNNVLGEINTKSSVISYLKTKKNFIINILNEKPDLLLSQFKISLS